MIKRAREGMRVRCTGYVWATGVPHGATGTIENKSARSIGAGSRSGFVYVRWDNGTWSGVFKQEMEKVTDAI